MEPERDQFPVAADGDAGLIDTEAAARIAVLHSGDDGWILVRPNRSLTRTGLVVATAACLSALMPATLLCALLGAWLVLPFVGLEVIVALGAFTWLARHRDDHERIVFNAEQVLHQRVDGRRRETHRFPRYWVQLVVEPGAGERRPARLWLRSHGRSIELGRDGSAPTRAVLARTLAREFGITRVRPSR
jgi:uncharacterized membrane protein